MEIKILAKREIGLQTFYRLALKAIEGQMEMPFCRVQFVLFTSEKKLQNENDLLALTNNFL